MILMSVDVESWVHRQVFDIPLSEQTKELDAGHVLRSTRIILELFKRYDVKATFFVLGTVAEWYPELIEDMKNDGHEVGIHGYTHTRLTHHTRESFDEEIKKTISILNGMGVTPHSYRSPAFTRADFQYEVLRSNGIRYDSSVFPVKTPLYDGTAYGSSPFIIEDGIIEVPCSVLKVSGIRIPVGGFYLRLFGGRLNHAIFRKVEQKNGIAVMYLHPWELLEIPRDIRMDNGRRVELSFLKNRFAYYKIPMLKQFEYLLRKLDFNSFEGAREYIDGLLA
jgi:polysaccharide deacetylase family protein (PEP-CTERM system associated)